MLVGAPTFGEVSKMNLYDIGVPPFEINSHEMGNPPFEEITIK